LKYIFYISLSLSLYLSLSPPLSMTAEEGVRTQFTGQREREREREGERVIKREMHASRYSASVF
jgi:hypothetical protein